MSTKYELKNLSTGKSTELTALSGTIGPEALDITHLIRDVGVFTYDPGFMATASTDSKITYIDGDAGVLLYRGYPVEQLAEKSSFLEVAHLLIHGELPTKTQLNGFIHSITRHTMINQQLQRFFAGFHHDAHPMAMVSAVVASMAAFYQDSTDINDPRHREIFSHRIIAKLPTIAAAAYKHTLGQPFVYPRNDLRYCSNMMNMFFAVPCEPYAIDPVAAEALDLLFILHADHEQNASTSTVRLAGSTGTNPYAAISSGVSALWGPAHGGANEAVLDMLDGIGSAKNIDKFLARVKDKSDSVRLMGFGHRVYKNFDPRAKIIRDVLPRARENGRWREQQSAVRARAEARGSGPEGRVLRVAQAVPERRLLFGHHLQRTRHPALDVHGAVRDCAHRRMGRALAGNGLRSAHAHRAPAPALHRPHETGLSAAR